MNQSAVEQIKERLSIVDVVGSYVELHKAGKSYKGKSPFTNEKTPSFFVSPDRGVYFCFSSQKGGDIFTFVQEMEGVDFKGALKILADRAGVELVPEDPAKRDARTLQYALLEEATQYFFTTRDEHPEITAYITQRGVTPQTIHGWRIGYAPDEWRALRLHLRGRGYTDADMLKAGLIKAADGGKEPYDVFRNRVMFPIMDASGRVVAFSGRTVSQEAGIPKYVNSPETELYVKSDILYGYDKAKGNIRHYNFSLVVEGQFDLVLAHQAGYTNTVAVSGTALTPVHMGLLERLSNRIVLALDADRAGLSAMRRSALPMLARGMDVKVAALPPGQDPADVVRADPTGLRTIVGRAEPVITFLLRHITETVPDERVRKLRARDEIIPLIAAIPNRIDQDHFCGEVATLLGSHPDAVRYEVNRLREETPKAPPQTTTATTPEVEKKSDTSITDRIENTRSYLAALASELTTAQPAIAHAIVSHLTELELSTGPGTRAGDGFSAEQLIEKSSLRTLTDEIIHQLHTLTDLVARYRLSLITHAIKEAERLGDSDRALALLTEAKSVENLRRRTITLD
jgi:DNA primase